MRTHLILVEVENNHMTVKRHTKSTTSCTVFNGRKIRLDDNSGSVFDNLGIIFIGSHGTYFCNLMNLRMTPQAIWEITNHVSFTENLL